MNAIAFTREERALARVSKDERGASWFETAQERLLTMRDTYSDPKMAQGHAVPDCFVACASRNDESNVTGTDNRPRSRS
jgi:hypothetical protein